MKKNSTTYRFFTLFMASAIAISISLSSALLAVHCSMNMQQQVPVSLTSSDYCPMMDNTSAHKNSDNHNGQKNSSCDWIISCDYNFDQHKVTTEAIPSITKTAKAFAVSVIRYVNTESTEIPSLFADAEVAPHSQIPPLFLLNNVFLN